MSTKKLLFVFLVLLSVMFVCACKQSDPIVSTDIQPSTSSTEPSTDILATLPSDSSLGDSVFDDESRAPTKAENEASDSDPKDNTQSSEASDPSADATAPNTPPEEMTYEAFTALTPEEQRLYQESFENLDAFFEWYVAAKEKYENENPPIEIDGPIDLEKY